MRFPWSRIVDAIAAALGRAKEPPSIPIPPAALDELSRWDEEDIRRYRESLGGIAPPDAPHIPDDGSI